MNLELGTHLKNLREGKGLTLVDLAQKTGVPQVSLSNVENGAKYLSPRYLDALAKALVTDREGLYCSAYKLDMEGYATQYSLNEASRSARQEDRFRELYVAERAEKEKLKQQLQTIKQLLEEF